jgi:16S rRNA (cytosine967-C5)-methyltransferase
MCCRACSIAAFPATHRAQSALLIGAAQILWMDVPDHAAVDLSVRLVQADRRAAKYAGLVNAVLRRCAREGQPLIEEVQSQMLDLPPWLVARWTATYGDDTTRAMAAAISVACARSDRQIRSGELGGAPAR